MKKIIQVCTAILLTFGIVGCGPKISEEAIDRYIEVSKNSTNMKSGDYTFGMDINLNGETVKAQAFGAFDAFSNLIMNMNVEANMQGEKVENLANLYIEENILYLDFLGEKQTLSFAQFLPMLDYLMQNNTAEINEEKVKAMLKAAEIKDNHLMLTIDSATFDEEIEQAKAENGVEDMEISISDMKMDITIEDEFMTNLVMDFEITGSHKETGPMKIGFHMTMGITNVNEDVNIIVPELTDYPEAVSISDSFQ